jgi:hypothetical protein
MELTRRLFFTIACLVAAIGCDLASLGKSANWVEVAETGQFTVRFPRQPEKEVEPTSSGGTSTRYADFPYTLRHSAVAPGKPLSKQAIEGILDAAQESLEDSFRRDYGGKLVARRATRSGAIDGREIEIAVDKAPIHGTFVRRLFITKNRLYQASVFVARGGSPERKRFFDGFVLK